MTGALFCQLRSFPPVTYVSIRSVRLSLASANLLVLLVETILLFGFLVKCWGGIGGRAPLILPRMFDV